MKIFLATLGSRGDFEPFHAFALGAIDAGHDVVLACTNDFADISQSAGISTAVLPGSIHTLIQDSGVSPLQAWKEFGSVVKPMMLSTLNAAADVIINQEPDVVIYHPKVLSAPIAARRVGAQSIIAEIVPLITPTKEFGAAGVGKGNFGVFNPWTYSLVAQSGKLFDKDLKQIAKRIGGEMCIHDFSACLVSPALLPRPHDWPSTTQLVGPWTRKGTLSVDTRAVSEFISQGPTILAGFGSMKKGDSAKRTNAVIESIHNSGFQALLVTGWGGLEHRQAAGVMSVEATDYEQVLPLVSGVIHHGGAGTVHAALRAGTPSVIVPFFADQPWWAERLYRLGLGPQGIPEGKLSARTLTHSLHSLTQFQPAVTSVQNKMSSEDGITATLSFLSQFSQR